MALPTQIGDVIAGRYRVLRTLGSGGYGDVVEAERVDGGASVAVKVMHDRLLDAPSVQQRFEREAAMLQQLRHPNIVQLLDFGQTDEALPFIAFELLIGDTLRRAIERDGALGMQRSLQVARQVLSALAAAHAVDVVHRDIKPENIFLCQSPQQLVKVLDFGIAKPVNAGGAATALTATGQMIGTPHYMAPEQVRGAGDIGAEADLYSLGTVIAEMLTGAMLVQGATQIDLLMVHIADEPLPLPEQLQGTPIGAIIGRAVAKDPAARFASAAEMLAQLDALPVPPPSVGPTAAFPATSMAQGAPPQAVAATHFSVPMTPAGEAHTAHQSPALAPAAASSRAASRITLLIAGAIGALLVLVAGVGIGLWLGTCAGAGDKQQSEAVAKRRSDKRKRRPPKKSKPRAAASKKRGARWDMGEIRSRLEIAGYAIQNSSDGRYGEVRVATLSFSNHATAGAVSVYLYPSEENAQTASRGLARANIAVAVDGAQMLVVIMASTPAAEELLAMLVKR